MATGESMDWLSVVPQRVPDEQNFAIYAGLWRRCSIFNPAHSSSATRTPRTGLGISLKILRTVAWSNEVDVVLLQMRS